MKKPIIDRIMSKVRKDETTGCWVWIGHTMKDYPLFKVNGRQRHPIRFLSSEPVRSGVYFNRTCATPRCVNPEHFRLGKRQTPSKPAVERFMSKVRKESTGCWIWVGSIDRKGHPQFESKIPQHFSYAHFVGPVPAGMIIKRTCGNRLCCCPSHLVLDQRGSGAKAHVTLRADLSNGAEIFNAEDREHFWSKVNKDGPIMRPELGPCWIWTDKLSGHGYGSFWMPTVGLASAHRASYALNCGGVPRGRHVLHRCDNRACVRPDHLFLGSAISNTRDMLAKKRYPTGDQHYSRRKPWLMARGDRSGSRLHPQTHMLGDNNPVRRRPDLIPRGDARNFAKLNGDKVVEIRKRHARGDVQYLQLAEEFNVSPSTIRKIVLRLKWKHIA